MPESILQIQAERIPEGHGTRPQTRPEGLRLCFDPITALRPCAPGAAISGLALVDGKATASRVKTIVCTRPTSSEVLPAKDTKRPCGVKQMLELKRRAPRSAYPGTCFPLG